jgi:hypothetical protein
MYLKGTTSLPYDLLFRTRDDSHVARVPGYHRVAAGHHPENGDAGSAEKRTTKSSPTTSFYFIFFRGLLVPTPRTHGSCERLDRPPASGEPQRRPAPHRI